MVYREIRLAKRGYRKLEDAKSAAVRVYKTVPHIVKIVTEYDWKMDRYINHCLGESDSYTGTYSVYNIFQRGTINEP